MNDIGTSEGTSSISDSNNQLTNTVSVNKAIDNSDMSLFLKKSDKVKLPSVRQLMQTIVYNHQFASQPFDKYHHYNANIQTLRINSQSSSQKSIQSIKSKSKRHQNISKLISLQNTLSYKDKLSDQTNEIEHNHIQSQIYTLVDQIHNYRHSHKAFISQQHFYGKEIKNKLKSKQTHQKINNNQSINQQHSKFYYKTLENNERYKKQVINPSRYEKTLENSLQKENQKSKKSQFLSSISNKKNPNNNKLIESKQMKKDVIKRQIITDRYSYKRKGKQYFHIQINKKSLLNSQRNIETSQILPQIKVNGKSKG